jgi:hypothetical protein
MGCMQITASLRVRSDGTSRASRADMEAAAGALRAIGFEVLHLGRFSLVVRADTQDFERQFKVSLEPGTAFSCRVTAESPDLAPLIDHLEIVPPAQPLR